MSYIKKTTLVSRLGDTGEVEIITILPGMPIGLLLALTYARTLVTNSRKNVHPISRIEKSTAYISKLETYG